MSTREQALTIAVDDASIEGTVITPGTAMPGVLFVHGWGGSQEQYLTRAREIAALGCVCLTFDLRGHADTREQRESVSRKSNLRDVLAAYDQLARHPHVDRDAIAVVGSSYGGYLAAILTTLRKVRWLALRVPALYIDTGWEVPKVQLHKDQDLKAYRRSFIKAEDNRALRACADFEGDVLIVESEHDDTVPHPVITSYREACLQARSLTYRCLAGADHGLTSEASQRAYTALLTQWLGEMLAGARREGDQLAATAVKGVASQQAAAQTAVSETEPEAPPMAR
ncbi:alpha/beta hydrolase family protein [Azohydromonas caseinilytica]|uniref:Alpha/beta fold hydrolase n=1 Tax=Azohydromonas caseinilytica TaxID=2728836 RepID=A0A848F6D9_9BURK|nr:alpha/beta fold hydrolase [Azohydromonas caseinilytica]NML14952.1 alpha/beta fold hydrolase [Azohydromonas caseinilytica]